jgi:glycosyltransferase involved in cell wall biosynthesis
MHVTVQWPRLGPYHLARLFAASRMLAPHGIRVTTLESAASDNTYAWRRHGGNTPVETTVALPGENYDRVSFSRMWTAVSRSLDRLRPDAVATVGYSSADALSALAWCKRHGSAAVLMSESKGDDAQRTAWKERTKSLLVGRFDAALCGGTLHRLYLEELGMRSEKIWFGYDAVDNEFFGQGADAARRNPSAFRHLPGLSDGEPYYLACCRFVARKNIGGLVRAYLAYRQQIATAGVKARNLILLGDGAGRAAIESEIAALGVEGVVLPGFRQIEELPAYYGLASAFIHAPFQEQWGLVVNEAMAAGLPVLVSARCGCAPDLVSDGDNGYTFEPDNLGQITGLLVRLHSPEIDLAAMGRASQLRIGNWGLERFGRGLLGALRTAAPEVTGTAELSAGR